MQGINLQKIKVADLKFADYNPRIMDDYDFESLKNEIQIFGLVEPIVVNKDMTIVGGHQRVRAIKDLGWEEVECNVIDLSKDEEKILNLALNRITGRWDESKLMNLIVEIKGRAELKLTGFDDLEINQMLVKYQLATEGTTVATDNDDEMNKIFDRHQRVQVPVNKPECKIKKEEIGFYCDNIEQWKRIKEAFATSRSGELDTTKLIDLCQ